MISYESLEQIKHLIDTDNTKGLGEILSPFSKKEITSEMMYGDYTLLMYALEKSTPEIVKLLIEHGAAYYEISAPNNELKSAARNKKYAYDHLYILLSNNIINKEEINIDGSHYYMEEGDELVEAGMTPLLLCIKNGDLKSVELLIKYGAKLNIAIESCPFPLDVAIESDNPALVACLLENGARASQLIAQDKISNSNILELIKLYEFTAADTFKSMFRDPGNLGSLKQVLCEINTSTDYVYGYIFEFEKGLLVVSKPYMGETIKVSNQLPVCSDVSVISSAESLALWKNLIGYELFHISILKDIQDRDYGIRLEFAEDWLKWEKEPIVREIIAKYEKIDVFSGDKDNEGPTAIDIVGEPIENQEIEGLGRGVLVETAEFGTGKIIGFYNSRSPVRLEIEFGESGIKVLSPKYTKFKIVRE